MECSNPLLNVQYSQIDSGFRSIRSSFCFARVPYFQPCRVAGALRGADSRTHPDTGVRQLIRPFWTGFLQHNHSFPDVFKPDVVVRLIKPKKTNPQLWTTAKAWCSLWSSEIIELYPRAVDRLLFFQNFNVVNLVMVVIVTKKGSTVSFIPFFYFTTRLERTDYLKNAHQHMGSPHFHRLSTLITK